MSLPPPCNLQVSMKSNSYVTQNVALPLQLIGGFEGRGGGSLIHPPPISFWGYVMNNQGPGGTHDTKLHRGVSDASPSPVGMDLLRRVYQRAGDAVQVATVTWDTVREVRARQVAAAASLKRMEAVLARIEALVRDGKA